MDKSQQLDKEMQVQEQHIQHDVTHVKIKTTRYYKLLTDNNKKS